MSKFCRFWLILTFFGIFCIVPGIQARTNVEVSFGTPEIKVTNAERNPSSSSVTVKTVSSIEIAVYVTSCLAVFFITVCCFYCCKHFCCDGCRGEASVTYQQMGPTPFNTGSIRIPVNEPIIATTPKSNANETQVDMIPLQGMKRVTFASKVNPTQVSKDLLPSPPYEYENFP